MTINFPGSLDNFTNPTSSSPINSPSHADQHANANDAIEALEAKVGVDGSSVVTSHDYKIAQLQSLVTSAVAGAKSIYQDVRNQSGSAFTKATPVYVSGSTGASGQLLVSAASNATEATSSKTMGITTSAISNNSNGQVISEGILEGIDTTGAADGDPVWLGVNGAKIYGLANKPSAPAHLVFLGIVIRGGQANTGSMYVKIQNGFELQEIHNVEISSLINGNILTYDSTTQTWKNTNTIQSTSSTIPLVVKGSTSQSVAMQQWQDSGGTIHSEIRNSGQFRNQAGAILGNRNGSTLGILTLYNNNAAVIPLVVQAAASQTANLQEWQNSSGTVLASIYPTGFINTASGIGAGTTSYMNGIDDLTATKMSLRFNSTSYGLQLTNIQAGAVGYIVKAAASQTANLQEWQNSAGSVLSSITSNGYLAVGGATTGSFTSLATVRAGGSSQVGVAIGTEAGTSSDALRIFNATGGTILTTIKNTGEITAPLATFTANATSVIPLTVKAIASQTANLQEWQNSAGTVLARVGSGGAIVTSGVGVFGSQSNTPNAQLFVLGNSTSNPVFVVKGAASQSGDLQQWQDSAGTIKALIGSGGNGVFNGVRSGSGSTTGAINAYTTAAQIGILVQGAASQTANLQEWRDSTATVLANIDAIGSFTGRSFKASGYITTNSSGGTYTNYWCKLADFSHTGQYTDNSFYMDFYVYGPGFTYVPRGKLFVRSKQQAPLGSAPETPTIVVYNGEGSTFNASDFALVAVQNDSSLTKYELYYKLPFDWAHLVFNPTMVTVQGPINFYNSILPISTLPSGTKTYGRNPDSNFNSVLITPSTNTSVNLIVKPIAGQTYNLTEWQNSGGGIVSYVTSSGAISSNTAITATSFVKSGGTASQFLKADGSTDSSTYLNSTTSSYVAGHHPEGRILASAALVNDLGNARLRGSTFTFTNISPSNSDIDKMFDGTANFLMISPTSSQTFPIVIEFTLPRTLSWGAVVGIGFGTSTWRTNSVKIEAFSEGAWVTCIDTTTNTSEDVLVGIPGNSGTGTTKLRYTLANPNSSQLRICHLWAYNYNSDMWTHLQMPRAGGTMYGALSTKGAISVLNSSNTAMSYLNQDGSGALAVTDPFGGISWNIYGNLGIRTSGASGGQVATVKIGSMTQASNTAALTLYGHTEFGSLTNSAPIQTWSKADGTLLAKVDQFGAFTVNINSASSVPLTLKAASSQSANIQEWQNSANVVKLAVDSTGFIRFDDQTSSPTIKWGNATVWESVGGTASMRINPYGPGYIGLIVKGFASQTADLQQWQDSNGNTYAKIGPYGQLAIGDTNPSIYSNARISLNTVSASAVGQVIRGVASQTANLQEWQNSSGTVLVSISAGADLNINTSSTGRINLGDAQISKGPGTSFIFNSGINSGNIYAQSTYSGSVVLTVKGTSGQQQYFSIQDSSGSAGIYVDQYMQMIHATNTYFNGIINNSGNWSISNSGNLNIKQITSNISSTISVNTASTVDTSALSSFTSMEYTLSIKQGSKIRSSKVLVHTDGTSVDSTEYGIMEMGGGISGILVTASVSGTNAILQVTITDATTTNATVKLIKTML